MEAMKLPNPSRGCANSDYKPKFSNKPSCVGSCVECGGVMLARHLTIQTSCSACQGRPIIISCKKNQNYDKQRKKR